MFGARLSAATMRLGAQLRGAGRRQASSSSSSLATMLYENVWRKSNVFYVTYIAAGCVILEVIYGSATNFLWESANRGVSHHFIVYILFRETKSYHFLLIIEIVSSNRLDSV
jgi:hypothetical protein